MMFANYKFKFVLLISAVLLVTACSGGGGGDDTPPAATDISGTVLAPSGAIALYENKSMLAMAMDILIPAADAITGTASVSGAMVELIEIDNDGNQVGAVIDSTTTAADGSYTLSTTKTLGTNLVIRVLSTAGTAAEIRAFVVADTTDISPASELVVLGVLDTIASTTGAQLSHFTADEISALTSIVDALSIDLTGTTIADAMATLEASAGAAFDQAVLTDITTDFSGSWDYTATATSSSCPGDYPVGTVSQGTAVVTQDGINVTIDSCGTCVMTGTVIDNVVTWSGTYPDGAGMTDETGSVTISADGLNAMGSNTFTYSESGFSCTISQNLDINKVIAP